jgi:hypothetical protein
MIYGERKVPHVGSGYNWDCPNMQPDLMDSITQAESLCAVVTVFYVQSANFPPSESKLEKCGGSDDDTNSGADGGDNRVLASRGS